VSIQGCEPSPTTWAARYPFLTAVVSTDLGQRKISVIGINTPLHRHQISGVMLLASSLCARVTVPRPKRFDRRADQRSTRPLAQTNCTAKITKLTRHERHDAIAGG
jgi:hypothetical protein